MFDLLNSRWRQAIALNPSDITAYLNRSQWRSTIPAAIHEVRYERLVADPERQTRELLAFCGLEWQDACGAFHENPDPSMTASALQVRRPLYDWSVAQWRHYEAQLAPLEEALRGAGVDTGAT